ncbi:MAG: rhomboid family intramembrane serine protease [Bacteroidales bacterium]|nr:rhomboid family intramembrane serine protease [Bacteroidales bacterium]
MSNLKSIAVSSMLTKLIAANVIVFVILKVAELVTFLFSSPLAMDDVAFEYLAVPADLSKLASRFWTPLTYMFLHDGFLHILGNMLWLFFLGKVFFDIFNGRRLFAVYILGGLSGALFYVAAYNLFPAFESVRPLSCCMGASAAVSAVVIAVCVYKPKEKLYFFGILPVELKWLGIIYVLIDLLSIAGNNPGGHISHLGGAAFGATFALCLQKGKDITQWFCSITDTVVSWFGSDNSTKRPKMKVTFNKSCDTEYAEATTVSDEEYNRRKHDENEQIDRILEKISKSGYDHLTKEEKDFLFRASRK